MTSPIEGAFDMVKKAGEDDKTSGLWSMGLRGVVGLVANCTAIGLICLMFYQDRHTTMEQYREDRAMFRDELKEQRKSLNKLTRAFEELAVELKRISRTKGKQDGTGN